MEKEASLSGHDADEVQRLDDSMFPNWVMNFDDRCHKLIDGGGNELEAESAGEAEDEDEEGQEYGYKAAEWTEDDQMDLMDLGTSEIERSKTITLKQGINKRLKEDD